jgi:hypothetical protein
MFILIFKHYNAKWDATIYASRAEAEQAIRGLSLAVWIETEGPEYGPPRHIAGCIDDLYTCDEHVKLFRVGPGAGPCEEIVFDAPAERAEESAA